MGLGAGLPGIEGRKKGVQGEARGRPDLLAACKELKTLLRQDDLFRVYFRECGGLQALAGQILDQQHDQKVSFCHLGITYLYCPFIHCFGDSILNRKLSIYQFHRKCKRAGWKFRGPWRKWSCGFRNSVWRVLELKGLWETGLD